MGWVSLQAHEEWMATGRKVYRQPLLEALLMGCVLIQVMTGMQKVRRKKWARLAFWDRIQTASGLYLAFFLLAHTSAILIGRAGLDLDTDTYFGAWAFQFMPLFFVPYYTLAILAFFGHFGALCYWGMTAGGKERTGKILGWSFLGLGVSIAVVIVLVFLQFRYAIPLPDVYQPYL